MIRSETPAAVPPSLGRRRACAALGASLGMPFLALALAACAGAAPRPRRDDKPFWEREEQRD